VTRRSGPKAELGLAVLLCLVGSSLVLLSTSRVWQELMVAGRPPLPDMTRQVEGIALVPGVRALALVGLAGVVALVAARRSGRVVVGLLLAVCGVAVVVQVGRAVAGGPPLTAWPWVCLAGGALLASAGALVVVRGSRWATLSRRYEPPGARTEQEPAGEASERALWEALDRGEDPTNGGPRQ
jgi:hypothetical protein